MRSKLNQRGQGTTEYLLILFLSVAIILGAIVQLNTAFRSWADNYFGEYLTCLLETGELPSLGGGSDGACDGSFKPFSLAEGRPALGNAIGEDGANGNGDKNGAAEQEAAPPTVASGSSDSGGAAASGGFNSSRRGGTRFKARRSTGEDGDGAGGAGSESGSVAFNSYDSENRVVRIPIRETDAMRRRRYQEDQTDKERTKTRTDKALSDGEREGAPVLIKKSVRKPTSEVEDDGFEWSFGNLLRILIILAILAALLLFLGGQILQISKSVD